MWEVFGHEKALKALTTGLEQGRLAHAYLFAGPAHVGKMTLAVNLAQAVNCREAERPCGECNACRRIKGGKHTDVQVVSRLADEGGRTKADISIDQVREFERQANLKAYEGQCRVFIIEDAEKMTTEAANCLLKTLEEPPPQVLLLLLTSKERQLLPTIVSRCRRIEMKPLPVSAVEQALQERWQAPPDKARVLARLSAGRLGWAMTAHLDNKVLEERSHRLARFIEVASAPRSQRLAYAAELAAQFGRGADSVDETLELWCGWWRDLLLVKGGGQRLIANVNLEPSVNDEAAQSELATIRRFLQSLDDAGRQLERRANPLLVLEVLMLSLPHRSKEREVEASPA
ncbi:MAG: DNA polymerase III subunit delta' [Dehalococcoidia bacterium]|nr:DNA polymerase III subunit delta' [Dehalococcoidia bacterium]